MTSFATNDIPNDIDTVEKLFAWCGEIMNLNSPNDTYPESISGSEFIASVRFGKDVLGQPVRLYRFALHLESDYAIKRAWDAVKEQKSGVVPDGWKTPAA